MAKRGAAGRRLTLPRIQLREGLAFAAVLLVLAIWLAVVAAVSLLWRQTHQQMNVAAGNLADAYAWQIHRDIQGVDQTLAVAAALWADDPAHVDAAPWRTRAGLLSEIGEQISLVDPAGRIVASTQPRLVGFDLHERDVFTDAVSGQGNVPLVSFVTTAPATGQPAIIITRRLLDAQGKLLGLLMATVDMRQWAAHLGNSTLSPNGLVALISPGPVGFRLFDDSPNAAVSLAGTKMWQAMLANPQGQWVGPSAFDGLRRLHAFRSLSVSEPGVVVGIDYDSVMQQTTVWRRQALLFGLGLTFLVIAAFGLLVRQVEDARDREEQVGREREKLAAAYQALATAHAHADAKSNELSATIAGMSDGIMMLDGDLRLMQWNEHYPEIDGVPREALRVGMSIEEILRIQVRAGEFGVVDEDAEVERRMALFRNPRAAGLTGTGERTRPNQRTVELRRSALAGGGFVTLYTDITPRKQAQALQDEARRMAEQVAEAKSRFVAIVSHEIRTPLNAVLNALALLNDSHLLPAQRSLTERAAQAGAALLHLLTDILEMSKMEAGQLALRPEIFALRPLLDGVQEMFDAPAKTRGMTLTVQMVAPTTEHAVLERMRGDPGRLRQILMNLVSNAVKYTRPGTVTIRAESLRVFGRLTLLLSVRDSGPAIAAADAKRLFEPFVRLENAAYASGGGTGLGLAICHRLAELMGGKIGLRPFEGGNEFWVSIPIEAVGTGAITWSPPIRPPETYAPPGATRGATRRPPRTRILLVEDLPANQVITATMLQRESHLLHVARSGAEAVAMVQQTAYDVVLMDISMPGMSGLQAAQKIRALPAPMRHLPIIAVTANSSGDDMAACLAAGMVDMLAKPVSTDMLQAALLRHVWLPQRPLPAVAPAAVTPSVSGLDLDRIDGLRAGLTDTAFSAVVDACLADLQQLIPALRMALIEGKLSEIMRLAHAIAGVAGTYGLVDVQRRVEQMEQAARRGDHASVQKWSNQLEDEAERSIEAMRAYVLAQAA